MHLSTSRRTAGSTTRVFSVNASDGVAFCAERAHVLGDMKRPGQCGCMCQAVRLADEGIVTSQPGWPRQDRKFMRPEPWQLGERHCLPDCLSWGGMGLQVSFRHKKSMDLE